MDNEIKVKKKNKNKKPKTYTFLCKMTMKGPGPVYICLLCSLLTALLGSAVLFTVVCPSEFNTLVIIFSYILMIIYYNQHLN